MVDRYAGVSEDLQLKLDNLPAHPGVYIYRDAAGKVIYVGKATSLRNRVRQYFQASRGHDAKTLALVAQIADLEYITTGSEVEALILEANLIKKYRPYFNIKLRDDKHYPYLRIDLNDDFPKVTIARSMKRDGAKYFGPYTDVVALRETLRNIRRVFPFRSCGDHKFRTVRRPCLDFHIRRCLGPCHGKVGREEYRAMIRDFSLFLEGRQAQVLASLKERMEEAAERLDFERAAEIRDQMLAMSRVAELHQEKIISSSMADQDVIGLARQGDEAVAQIFFVRDGKVVGRENFSLTGAEDRSDAEILAAFIQQYYEAATFIPREVLLPVRLPEDEAEVLEKWLSERRGHNVRLHRPQRGDKRDLVQMATENAGIAAEQWRVRRVREQEMTGGAVEELQRELGLARPPRRIECYDISNIQGTEAVGSMVVFEDGRPKKEDYRRFKIRSVQGPNDFAMMQEVLFRRFRRGLREREAAGVSAASDTGGGGGPAETVTAAGTAPDRFATFPDLLIVDGGKGQLSAAREVMRDLGVADIPTFGLAKEEELLFAEGRSDPIVLPRGSDSLFLVQRVRDEAHRFAVGYHRKLRGRRTLRSALDDIPGVGPARRTALLRAFGSLAKLRSASLEEIAAAPGVPRPVAEAVYARLHGGAGGNSREEREEQGPDRRGDVIKT